MMDTVGDLVAMTGKVADELRDLTDAHDTAGRIIEAAVRAPRVTGRLAASITVESTPGATTIGSDLVYAGVIHGGWAARNIRPQPFLTDALTTTSSDVVDLFHDHVTDIIRSA